MRFTTSAGSAPGSANVIGTARVRSLTFDSGTPGTQTAVYKMYLFDLKMNSGYSFATNAKSFFYSKSGPDFTADIQRVTTVLAGSATTYTTYPTKGASTTLSGIGTAWLGGTTTSPALKVGDYIYVGDPASGGVRRRVTTVTSNNTIVVDSSTTADGAIIYLVTTNTLDTNNGKLYFPLPNYGIRSVRSSTGTKEIIYYVTEYITGTTGSPTGTPGNPGAYCQLTISTGAGVFASPDEIDNFILVENSSTGTVVNPLSYTVGGSSSITFNIDCSSHDYSSTAFVVMGTVKKIGSDGGEKTKTLQTATVTFTSQATATKAFLSLGKADIFLDKLFKIS